MIGWDPADGTLGLPVTWFVLFSYLNLPFSEGTQTTDNLIYICLGSCGNYHAIKLAALLDVKSDYTNLLHRRRDISLKMKHPDFSSFKPYIGVESKLIVPSQLRVHCTRRCETYKIKRMLSN